jgi:hypothetical protein
MNMQTCCQRLNAGDVSPFEVSVLGWYDGMTSGVVKCRGCGRTYHAEMLSWEVDQDTHEGARVFGLKQIHASHYEALVAHEAQATSGDPRDDADCAFPALLRDALAAAFGCDLYVCASNLSQRILGARSLSLDAWLKILAAPAAGE